MVSRFNFGSPEKTFAIGSLISHVMQEKIYIPSDYYQSFEIWYYVVNKMFFMKVSTKQNQPHFKFHCNQ